MSKHMISISYTLRKILSLMPVLILLSLLIGSCSSEVIIEISGNDSGEASMDVRVFPVLSSYFQDITGDYSARGIIDPIALERELNSREGLELTDFATPEQNRSVIDFAFTDPNRILAAEVAGRRATTGLLAIIDGPVGSKKIEINLNRENTLALLSLGPISSNVLSSFLLPSGDSGIDADSYREDLIWALGDYAPESELEELLDGSAIKLIIPLDSQPRELRNGRILARSEATRRGISAPYVVVFEIPLLELLTISTPGLYSVIY